MVATQTLLTLLRSWLPRESWPRRSWRAYRRWKGERAAVGPSMLRAFSRAYPEALFLQIGSNDGTQLDPLRQAILASRWRGIMIEPVPYVFERLRKNTEAYSDRIRLENVAIGDRNGSMPFYHLQEVQDHHAEGLPFWYDQLGSFRKDVVLKHADRIPDIAKRLVEVDVPCSTFDALCERNGVSAIDLLHMDTEGYDFVLLQMIDLDRYRPRLLVYEHYHLNPREKAACSTYLATHGYEGIEEGMDTWCLRTRDPHRRDRRLLRTWSRLKALAGAGA